jgi:hypothetical protein
MPDETSHDQSPDLDAATPNRDRRHEPPVIEGEVAADDEVAKAADDAEPLSAAAPQSSLEAPPADEAPIAPPAPKSRALSSAAIGAVVGALVAAGGVWLAGQRPATDPNLGARLDALEKSASGSTGAVAALEKRVGALETAPAAASDKGAADAYGQRIAALEGAALSAKAAADANADALAEAQAARADAAKALALASAAAQNGGASSAASSAPAPTSAPPGPDIGALQGRLDKLEAGLAALNHPPIDLGPLDQRIGKIESALAAPKNETRVPPENTALNRDWAGLAVVAQALSNRLAAGAPFTLEQTALEHLGADPAKLAALKPLADKGAPTAGALASDFAAVSPAVLAAATPKASGGVMDRLVANMGKVVRVTPVGEVPGDDPAALVSQIGAALERGQVAQALAAWGRLPEPAQQASEQWAHEAQARQAADIAAQSILDDALTRLAAVKG